MAVGSFVARSKKLIFQLPLRSPYVYRQAPSTVCRYASGLSKGDKRSRDQPKSKKKARTEFINQSLKDKQQFSLCDAMRYGSKT